MQIKTKTELKKVLIQDAKANRRISIYPKLFGDEVWKFIWMLRHNEFYDSLRGVKRLLYSPFIVVNKLMFHNISVKCGFSIPKGIVGKGLGIAHIGNIVINSKCIIGDNLRIHEGVTLGATSGSDAAPIIGNNVFIGSGAKVIGEIRIADDVAIGANAVVVKDINEPGTTWAGVPAKKISDKSSRSNLSPILFLNQ